MDTDVRFLLCVISFRYLSWLQEDDAGSRVSLPPARRHLTPVIR